MANYLVRKYIERKSAEREPGHILGQRKWQRNQWEGLSIQREGTVGGVPGVRDRAGGWAAR